MKEEKENKQEKAIRPWVESWKREPYSAICGEFQREQDTQEERALAWEVLSMWRDREIQRESVREWKKNETFFFAQVTCKKNKLVEFSWNFWVLQP